MAGPIPRLLLTLAAAIFAVGGALHGRAFFASAQATLDASGLKPFFGSELKVLWLADSTTLIGLGLVFGLIVLRPQEISRELLILISVVPLGTVALLYLFLGGFYAAHLLAAA